MLNKAILDPEVSRFIRENLKKDLPTLILKGSPFEGLSVQELAVQIKGLQIAEKKFPELFHNQNIIYPPKLNLEQTSSEATARYKASLVSGDYGIDITGGLGIDTYYLSRNFRQFDYCELNTELAAIAEHNFKVLGARNISVNSGDGLAFLENSENTFDWIYADPARRDDHGGKVFKFEDCEPDIPKNIDLIFNKTDKVLLKSSPIIDISAGIKELKFVTEIHVIAVKNEVKELLWILKKDSIDNPEIYTRNFEKESLQQFSGKVNEQEPEIEYSKPLSYLYEPNAAIMKSGLFELVASKTDTKKLHQHSHLYTSEELIEFPGRNFKVIDIMKYKPSYLKKYFKKRNANVTTRNFPESVENLRKKFKIKEGGSDYIFFTTGPDSDKIVIFCKKV